MRHNLSFKKLYIIFLSFSLFACAGQDGSSSSSSNSSSSLPGSSGSLSSSSLSSSPPSSSLPSSSSSSGIVLQGCSAEIEAGEDTWGAKCVVCHGTPRDGTEIWSGGLGSINLYDSDNNGFKNRDGAQINQSLTNFISDWMPNKDAASVSDDEADNLAAYVTHEVNTDKGWCPGDEWPGSRSTNGSSSSAGDLVGGSEKGKQYYNTHCFDCHGERGDGIHKLNTANISATTVVSFIDANMPVLNPQNCAGECAVEVAKHVLTFPALARPELDWDIHSEGSPSRIRKLSQKQLATMMESLTGIEVDISKLPVDARIKGETLLRTAGFGYNKQEISKLDVYFYEFAKNAANSVRSNSGCNQSGQGQKDCLNGWAKTFMSSAYNRNLTSAENDVIGSITNIAGESNDDNQVVAEILYFTFSSPSFLYFSQLGEDNASGIKRNLTNTQIAERLSLFLTNMKPDAQLQQAAASGALSNSAARVQHFERLWNSDAGRKAQFNFILDWVGASESKAGSKDVTVMADLPDDFPSTIQNSAMSMVSGVLGSDNPTLSNLLTTTNYLNDDSVRMITQDKTFDAGGPMIPADQCNTTQQCKTLFGDTANDCSNSASAMSVCMCGNQRCDVAFPSGDGSSETRQFGDTALTSRQGLLMHPYVIAALTKTAGESPFKIGIDIKQTLLCDAVKEPPAGATEQALQEAPAGSSQIEELRYKTNAGTVCLSCHLLFNDIGFAFMPFDPLGRWQKEDSNLMVEWNDLDGDIPTWRHEKVVFDSPADLAQIFATDPQVLGCLSQATVEWALGRQLIAQDRDFAISVNQTAKNTDGNIYEIFKAIVSSPEFTQVFTAEAN